MEERDGIAGDIMEAATTAAREIGSYCIDEDMKSDYPGVEFRQEEAAAIIARAIRAERERCARIAETYGVYPELNVFGGGPEWYRHGKNIARAIRNP